MSVFYVFIWMCLYVFVWVSVSLCVWMCAKLCISGDGCWKKGTRWRREVNAEKLKIRDSGPGAVAQATQHFGGRCGWITRSRNRDHPGQHGETPSLLKIQKISWAWWRVPVIPATQEAEAGELPEPRRRRLRWAEIAPLHSSLGNKRETPSQKKTSDQNSQETNEIGEGNKALLYLFSDTLIYLSKVRLQ